MNAERVDTTETVVTAIEAASMAYSKAIKGYVSPELVAAYLAGAMRGIDVTRNEFRALGKGLQP